MDAGTRICYHSVMDLSRADEKQQIDAGANVLRPQRQGLDWRRKWEGILSEFEELTRPMELPMDERTVHAVADRYRAFFCSVYHLKDALAVEVCRQPQGGGVIDVEAGLRAQPTLLLVADLCNVAKHHKLDKPPRSGVEPEFVEAYGVSDEDAGNWRVLKLIRHGNDMKEALDVARSAIEAWRTLLVQWGLL